MASVLVVVMMLIGAVGFAQSKQELIDELVGILNANDSGDAVYVESKYYEEMDCICSKYKLTEISTSDYNSMDAASQESLAEIIQNMCVHPYEALQSLNGLCDDTSCLTLCMTSTGGAIKLYMNSTDISWILRS